ncbi:MAG: PA14 domain-containing protein, partial [Chloroflexota bacterium]
DLILAVLGIIVAENAHTLYVRRPSDSATWAAYASAEMMAAQQINRLVATHAIYLADVWLDHPTIQYLARDLQGARRLDAATTLPFEEDQTFAYFAPGRQEVVAEDLERLYEDGEIDRFRSPLNENVVVLRTFRAPAKVVSATRGVTVRTMSNDRDRTARFTLPTFTFNWPLSDEVPREAALDAFAVLAVDTPGPYRFRLDGPSDAVLEVNGAQVSGVGNEVSVQLPGGTQRLRVHARVAGRAKLQLLWAPPGVRELSQIPADRLSREQRAASGLLALYRSGSDPAAEPTLARVERYVQREGSPAPVSRPYVLDLIGTLDAPRAGTYRFRLTGSGAASMWIDDQALVTGDEPGTSDASIVLSEGDHRLRVRLVDEAAPTHLNLAWSPPGEEFGAIPTSRFNPPDGPLEAVAASIADESTGLRAFGMPRVRWLASVDGEPRSVAVSEDGAVFVTNTTAREAQQVIDGGRALVPVSGSGASLPADLEIGPDGALWVLDALDAQLRRIDRTSGSVSLVGGRELGLYRPRGFAFAPDGSIVIADTGGSRLVRIRQDGTLLEQIGPAVGGSQRLRQPTDVAVGPGGELFVVNGEDGGVLRLSADGTFLTRWTVLPADTERGAHIAVAPDGAIWVSEPDGRRLSRFTRQGAPAGVVDQTREGRLLRSPTGIAVGPDGTLYVADGSLRAVVAIDLGR